MAKADFLSIHCPTFKGEASDETPFEFSQKNNFNLFFLTIVFQYCCAYPEFHGQKGI